MLKQPNIIALMRGNLDLVENITEEEKRQIIDYIDKLEDKIDSLSVELNTKYEAD